MFKRIFAISILMLVFSLTLLACQTDSKIGLKDECDDIKDENEILIKEKEELEMKIDNLEKSNLPINLVDLSLDVMESIKEKDMNALSTYIHESKGLRFTPYTNIDIENDRVFNSEQVIGLNEDNTIYNWGNYDGSGHPIDLKFSDYYDEFIYSQDFLNPQMIGNNMTIGMGNSINNIDKAYPNGSFIEFHFTGIDPQYEGIDWESLKLVFEEDNGNWKLVGIVHDQWTI